MQFAEHDFFHEQPVKGASMYLLPWILHDSPDGYAIRILQALVPAMQGGCTILICEQMLPELGSVSIYQARALRYVLFFAGKDLTYKLITLRSMDLAMLEFHNAKERNLETWTALLNRADPGFHLVAVKQPEGSQLAILVVKWYTPSDEFHTKIVDQK